MSNRSTDVAEAIGAVVLGIAGGVVLAAILEALSKNAYRCPSCNNPVKQGSATCPYCHTFLRWD